MLRGDNVICGTSTTGTGTLTLAATPVPPGGIDIDVWARANGYGNNGVFIFRYAIIEFTDSTFGTAKQIEIGRGLVTLGASAGIANVTLARSVLEMTATSLNSQPATMTLNPGSGITIGTAANVLVTLANAAADLMPCDTFQHANSCGAI